MGDHNDRIGRIVRAFEEYGTGDTNVRMTIRHALRAERQDGWLDGYSEGIDDQYQGSKAGREAADKAARFGDLDEDGRLTPDTEHHDMWTIAAWLPKGREGEVAEFLRGHGIAVYRMWPGRLAREPGTKEGTE